MKNIVKKINYVSFNGVKFNTIRELSEYYENIMLSNYATLSKNTKGRTRKEKKCEIRTEFQRDRDRILHCRSFRRLKHKTQVFIAPDSDHFRTRLTHTLEVMQIARTISRALRLNEDLTEAIALGHDLGHTPFGHTGEQVLQEITKSFDSKKNFYHYEQSLRVVDFLENNGKGLNLTFEVRDGILKHSKGTYNIKDLPKNSLPQTLEGKVVKISDRIAYINHDIADALRAKIITNKSLPKKLIKMLGNSQKERINKAVFNVINSSININDIKMGKDFERNLDNLKDFMFEKVYNNKELIKQNAKVKKVLKFLFKYFFKNFNLLPEAIRKNRKNEARYIKTIDYIAGMTDNFALEKYNTLVDK